MGPGGGAFGEPTIPASAEITHDGKYFTLALVPTPITMPFDPGHAFAGGPQAPQGDPAGQAEMANVMLTKLANDGMIVREGDMISSQVSYDKGQMLVNGKPVGRPPQ